MAGWQLAQLNVAQLKTDWEHPSMTDFVALIDGVNALADASPGFIWRLEDEETGDATSYRPFGDDMLVNLSVWEDIDSLRAFVFDNPDHVAVMKRRGEWFERMEASHLVMWWVPAGHIPTEGEAAEKLALIESQGATAEAFDFRQPFPPPAS